MALAGKNARILMTTGVAVAFNDVEATVDATGYVYSVNKLMDPETPVVVSGNSGVIAPTEYSVGYAGGRIRFKETREPGDVITVSGKEYTTYSGIGQAKGWELGLDVDMEETTVLGDQWKTYMALLKGGTVSLERFAVDAFFLEEIDRPLYLLLYVSAANAPRIECIGKLTTDSYNTVVSGLVGETVEFVIDGEPHFALA